MNLQDKLDFIKILTINADKHNPFSLSKYSDNYSSYIYNKYNRPTNINEMICPICRKTVFDAFRLYLGS